MSVKLYRHNESGEVVAAVECVDTIGNDFYTYFTTKGERYGLGFMEFESNYTPLPEAPDVGSTAWAVMMMEQGHKVYAPLFGEEHVFYIRDKKIYNKKYEYNAPILDIYATDWELYEEPKPIVECLPHEFVQGQKVLVRDLKSDTWLDYLFSDFMFNDVEPYRVISSEEDEEEYGFKYCIPYAGNEHLEGQITDGEHGAVPKGYVPPHVPKFGDETYWCVGDEVVNLCTMKEYKIVEISPYGLNCEWNSQCHIYNKHQENLRNLYHKGSYVREDGTVHEHIPTRPHKILDPDAKP